MHSITQREKSGKEEDVEATNEKFARLLQNTPTSLVSRVGSGAEALGPRQ